MDCPDITTLEEAEAKLPSSVVPISGLRRKEDGILTDDAINTVMDGLKSRGFNLNDNETRKKVIADLGTLLCTIEKQYAFLIKAGVHVDISDKLIEKNLMMVDSLTISRHIMKHPTKEGMQGAVDLNIGPAIEKLRNERNGFKKLSTSVSEGFSDEVQKYMVDVSKEKNRLASNYLGIYGFLNLFAVGLLIYVAASK
jgi:hypothetical protein